MHFVHISLFLCKGNKKLIKKSRFFCFFSYLCTKIVDKAEKMGEINEYRKELRSRIIDYAMGEFYKRGVRAVKMDEISHGLHVSKRTVYEIFGDKEELLLAGMKREKEERRNALLDYAEREARNVIDILAYVYHEQMKSSGQVGAAFFEEIHRMPRIVEFIKKTHDAEHDERFRFFKTGVEEGFFRDDVDYELMMEMSDMTTEEIMHRQFYKQYSMNELFQHWYIVIMRGICTERGLKLLNELLASPTIYNKV